MKIEVLYSEVANLYGDLYNINYLAKCLPNVKVHYTNLNVTPLFVNHKVDLIYMGPMMENHQKIVIEKLLPYKDRIKELIENNVIFLICGNALEIFGSKIDDINGLNIFDYYSKRDFSYHHHSCFIGEYKNKKIVGFKSQFSMTYNNKYPFIKKINGYGLSKDDLYEGVLYKNFIATYLIGPFLICNPYFTKYLLKLLGQNDKLLYEKDLIKAYNVRVNEFLDDRMKY